MIRYFRSIAIPACVSFGAVLASASGAVNCSDHRVVASAIISTSDVQAFVQCAAEYVRENGPAEARRAFNEDERWHHGPTYVFVDGIAESGEDSVTYVFPPDPSREGSAWGTSIDSFGTDYFYELHRLLSVVDSGWIYYAFTNPANGRDEPKSSYVIEIDWDGERAAIGAGLYGNDRPGTCNPDEVNAAGLSSAPSDRKLQELVRCAALMVESEGYFANGELEGNSRWSDGSSYVFVMDMMGNQVMSSSRVRVNGIQLHEWGGNRVPAEPFGGRDILAVGDSFGESFIYYRNYHPVTGVKQLKVGLLKRVVAQGVPLLVGSGYYLSPDQALENPSCSDNYIVASAVSTREDVRALVHCAAEYAADHGIEEAYRAFHDDSRWDHHEYYVFVRMLEQPGQGSSLLVYPPDQSREGIAGTSVHDIAADVFSDYYRELHRVAESFGSGWIHYYFINRETGTVEPKSSYFKEIDWGGQRAVIAAGIFERDLPGTCNPEQVNAAALEADPSDRRLQEFVRCATARVESMGFFAGSVLASHSRWRSGPIHVFGINATTGDVDFSGNPSDSIFSEGIAAVFDGRDMVGVVDTLGEAYWYYNLASRGTGEARSAVAFVKRVLAQGVPLLVGSGYHTVPGPN